jgi:hypothetical protein
VANRESSRVGPGHMYTVLHLMHTTSNCPSRDNNEGDPKTNHKYAISTFYGGLVAGINLLQVPKYVSPSSKPSDDKINEPEADFVDVHWEGRAYFSTLPVQKRLLLYDMEAEIALGTSVGVFGETLAPQILDSN